MRTDVTSLAVFGTAYPVLFVAFLATLSRHHSALFGRFVLWDIPAVATGAGKRGIAVWAGLGRMARGAITYSVRLGGGGYFARRVQVHQTSVTIGTLLLIVLGMRHSERGPQTCLWTRFPWVTIETTGVVHRGLFWQAVPGCEMRDDIHRPGCVHLDIAWQARFGMAVQAGDAGVR